MKPMIRLVVLVLAVLASVTTLASAAKTQTEPSSCVDFCSIVYCAGSQTCGPTAGGCGCHD